jgi:hypothetical protein
LVIVRIKLRIRGRVRANGVATRKEQYVNELLRQRRNRRGYMIKKNEAVAIAIGEFRSDLGLMHAVVLCVISSLFALTYAHTYIHTHHTSKG